MQALALTVLVRERIVEGIAPGDGHSTYAGGREQNAGDPTGGER